MIEHQPLYLKYVGFVGRISDKRELRDMVYLLGGAPVDNIPAFTNYIVVGDGGEETQNYKKVADSIENGHKVAITPELLRDIFEGKAELPMPNPKKRGKVTIFTTDEIIACEEQRNISVWQNKRDLYVERYGAPMADGSRVKTNVRAFKLLVRVVAESGKDTPQ